MKTRLLNVLTAFLLLIIPILNFAQAPPLGAAAGFVLFSSVGAVGNTGTSQITGNVGTNDGDITGFGNVNGVMHDADGVTAQCVTDLLNAYNLLDALTADYTIASPIGNGAILTAGVYSVPGIASTLADTLFLDGDANDEFILKVDGTLSSNPNSIVVLKNGALACNVYWKVEGLVSIASGTKMVGTIIANNAAIDLSTGTTLEGRALSTNGAVNVYGVLAYTPIGCNSPILTGPTAPVLASTACYAIFSSIGGGSGVTDDGTSTITGDVGTNSGLTTGYNPLLVTGTIHPIADGSTGTCATDLGVVYTYLNTLSYDIELLYPAQFGNDLVLTPHTYLLNAGTTFTGSLYLNAMGEADAVFVIQINGALTTSTYSNVVLMNGTLPENVYWKVDGAIEINDYSDFNGTIVSAGAINLKTGVTLNGRALTTSGSISTAAITATMPPGCVMAEAPLITAEPINQETCPGDSVSFTVVATGDELTYQWRNGTEDLIDGGNISGATSDTLTINPASISDVSANYHVVVSGLVEPNDTSINVSLVVNAAPIIITEPANQAVCAIGDSVSFTVEATGTGLTYQWKKGTLDLLDGINITGANSDTLTINPVDVSDIADNYYVIVSGTCLPSDTSMNVSLEGNSMPTITTEPEDQTVCTGSSVVFSVVATGTDITYQWRKGTLDLIDGVNISGATSDTLIIDPVSVLDSSSVYYVVVSGTCSPNDTSVNVSLAVNTASDIIIQPVDQVICSGNTAIFTVTATGTDLTYQWRKGDLDIANGGNISGANTDSLVIESPRLSDRADNYNVVITGICTPNDTSANASLEVNSAPIIVENPRRQTACAGNSVSFSVEARGTDLTYQWRRGTFNLIDGEKYSGATSETLSIDSVGANDEADNYNVVISGICSPDVTSENVSLFVDSAPYIAIESGDLTVCAGGSASLWVIATGSSFTFQWRKGTVNITDGGNIYGATTSRLYIKPVDFSDAADNYNVVVKGVCFADEISSDVSLKVGTTPIITTQPADQIVCAGNSASFSVESTETYINYQWRKGTVNLIDDDNISGATTNTLTINSVADIDVADDYNVVIIGTCTPDVISENVSLEIQSAPNMVIEQGDQTACIGSSASFSVAETGTGNSYQWRKGTVNLSNSGNISGVTSNLLRINPVNIYDADDNYNVVISGTCFPEETSSNVSLAVDTKPTVIGEPTDQTVCAESSASFSVSATGSGLIYQWRKGTINIINGGNISGANSNMLIIGRVNNSDVANNYNVVVSGTCSPSVTSTNASLVVETAPSMVIEPGDQTICAGSSVSFSVAATVTNISYQWRKGTLNLANGGNISGANSAVLTINPVQTSDAADNYNVVIDGTCFSNQTSMNVALVVDTEPRITSEPSGQTVCDGSSASFSVAAIGTDISYQWRKGTVNLSDGGNISGVNSSMLIISPANTSDAADNYNVVVTGACLSNKTSTNVSLTINTAPNIASEPTDQTVCAGSSVNFSVAATGTGLTYQWKKGTVNLNNGGNISGATSSVLTINSVNITDASANYNVAVSGTCSSMERSINVYLTVNTAPVIVSEPVDQSFCEYGCAISYLVAATGTGLSYQWRNGLVNLTNGGNISGANSAMLTINPVKVTDVSLNYNVVVSGICSPSITSVDAFLAECDPLSILTMDDKTKMVDIYPNPFTTSLNIMVNDETQINSSELRIFNALGEEVVFSNITRQLTTLETSKLQSGFYFYKVIGQGQVLQSGKLILKK